MTQADTELARSIDLYRQKRFADAAAACRQILANSPRHAGATHLLGLICKDTGDAVGGERLIRASIELDPRRPEYRTNLGNLLRRQGRLQQAEESYRVALSLHGQHEPARLGLAHTLYDLGQPIAAEAECRILVARNSRNTQAWSLLAGSLREQQRHAEAEAACRNAIALEPASPFAHHNLGALLSQMDRAEEALDALERAAALGMRTPELAVNRARTLFKLYRLDEAQRAYEEAIGLNPNDVDAQMSLADLRFMRGDPKFARSIVAAASARRDDVRLQLLFGDVLRRSGDLTGAELLVRDVLTRTGPLPEVRSSLATVLQAAGRLEDARTEAAAAVAGRPDDSTLVENLVAIQLSLGRHEEALPFIRSQRERQPNEQRWIAYEASAARLAGCERYDELYDYDLVRCYELEPPRGWNSMAEVNAALEVALNKRHHFARHPLGQSLRNGSQTARNLVSDQDAAVRAMLEAFHPALEDYRRVIGTTPGHPLSGRNSSEAMIKGCWSVLLHREGFHVNHIHPEGWISSAYYVSVPREVSDPDLMSGWIKFGEPRFPVPGAKPERFVRPQSGRLVLFPSYMWHGTNPIHGVEPRLTVAFDAVPKGSAQQ